MEYKIDERQEVHSAKQQKTSTEYISCQGLTTRVCLIHPPAQLNPLAMLANAGKLITLHFCQRAWNKR